MPGLSGCSWRDWERREDQVLFQMTKVIETMRKEDIEGRKGGTRQQTELYHDA